MRIRSYVLRPFVLISCCLAGALLGRAQSAGILFFDDFTGPSASLSTHSPKQGNFAWILPSDPAQALQSDGNGRAVFDPESAADGQRKHAWVDTGSTGDEYYVAAECSIEGLGEQAMTAAGMTIDEKRQGELSGAINAITIRPEYVASLEAR